MPLATSRPPRSPAGRPAPALKKRVHLLDVPFSLRAVAQAAGASWDPKAKSFSWQGDVLPDALAPFRSQPYSWERFKEDEINGIDPSPSVPGGKIVPRPHQAQAAALIEAAWRDERPGFLLADDVGLGKTISSWKSVLSMDDAETVLIVCPLAVVAHWRRTIGAMGDGGKRIVVINYDRLKKLFDLPDAVASKSRRKKPKRKVRTQKGLARFGEAVEFDVVLFDESHRLRNVDTARAKLAFKLQQPADFVIWMSATAGQHPLELAYLAPILAESTGSRASDLKEYESWCKDQGIGVKRGAYGKWTWVGDSPDPQERASADADLETMNRILFGGPRPLGLRRTPTDIAGWPEIQRILLPVELGPEDRILYDRLWSEFRRELGLERRGAGDPKNGLVARLRFRQKASLLRTASTVDLAIELLEQGRQVAISVFFKESLAVIREALEKEGYGVAVIDGSMGGPEKERQRLDFQHGRKTVCLYTVEEGISLHQGEYNDAPRINLIHETRWTAIQNAQIEGRCHRDGKHSPAYWMYAADTVEEQIVGILASRVRSMAKMQGDDTALADIERLLSQLAA